MHDPAAQPLIHRFGAMASQCEILLAGVPPSPQAQAALAAAEAEVRRIEHTYSRYRDDSIVSRINAAAGNGEPVAVDDETAGLLDFAAALHAASGGLFDITSGTLRQAWNFQQPRLPDAARLAALRRHIGWERVDWQPPQRRIRLPEAGMALDFGGFGKEYAADRAQAVLAGHGLRHGFVNLGGDIRVLGPQPDGRPWQFAIQHPRHHDQQCASIALHEGALATSGDYERYFDLDGQRYCHILDPRSGWPVRHWQSVSVTAPVCTAAGALSTIAMLLQADGLDFLRQQPVRFLAIGPDGQLFHEEPATDTPP